MGSPSYDPWSGFYIGGMIGGGAINHQLDIPAAPALATPTSVIGGAMLPIAYFSFLLLMNSPRALGDSMPSGGKRVCWNILMIIATD